MKNNILNGVKIAILLVGITAFSSCTGDFLEYNTNHYEGVEDDITSGTFFVQLQTSVIPTNANQYQRQQNLTGDIYGGHLAVTGDWFSGKNYQTYFLPINEWLNHPMEHVFVNTFGAWGEINKKMEGDFESPTLAWAQILKVASLHRLTDVWGPMPYSEVGNGAYAVKYDSQKEIYEQFFAELTKAIDVLTGYVTRNPGTAPMKEFDMVYNGDYTQWIKFANSLKLRLAMRVSYIAPELARKSAEEAVNHSIGVITSNDDNAQIKTTSAANVVNPIFTISNDYKECRMSAVAQSILMGYNDPRLPKYFLSTTLENDATGYFGTRTGERITAKARYEQFSCPNVEANTPLMWLNAAEVAFLKAEAALNGWNVGTTVEQAYNTGIRLSLEQHGAGAKADEYIIDETKRPADFSNPIFAAQNIGALNTVTIKWDESADPDTKTARIITQKWIAIFPNGAEAWAEYRRTGYPKQFPVKNNDAGSVIDVNIGIRRMPFPPKEYQLNADNISTAITLLGGPDNGGTPLWWDAKHRK